MCHFTEGSLSDSHRNDEATNCKHTLTFRGLTNNRDIMFTETESERNIQRIHEIVRLCEQTCERLTKRAL